MPRTVVFLFVTLLLIAGCSSSRIAQNQDDTTPITARERKDCWEFANAPTLLSVMRQSMQTPLEPELIRDSYIQTFGCAYEEIDIEKNSIQAVYRAIMQSLRNRNITVRDDLMALLNSRPPRPENLVREYSVYVNMLTATGKDTVASYQIRILQLEVVQTVESHLSVWTRVATRFQHREDHYRALPVSNERSAFVNVMEKAQRVLSIAQDNKIDKVLEAFASPGNGAVAQPRTLAELTFGDQLYLVDESNPNRTYPALFLGKGILFTSLPKQDEVVFKFGEERLFGLRLNPYDFRRLSTEFEEFGYKAPETILQCMFLKSSKKKLSTNR